MSGTACIGTNDDTGAYNFDFGIITPKALEREFKENSDIITGAKYFIIGRLDFELITNKIKKILLQHEGDTWEDIAVNLAPYFDWEYTVQYGLNSEEELLEMIRKHKEESQELE